MKQMRSRFRLLTLLLACAFLVTLAVCAGSALKAAGITLSSLIPSPAVPGTETPEPDASPAVQGTETPELSDSPAVTPGPDAAPAPSDGSPLGSFRDWFQTTDTPPVTEYNLTGL